jgi:hypothetical protein
LASDWRSRRVLIPGDLHLAVSDTAGFDIQTTTEGRGLGLTTMQARLKSWSMENSQSTRTPNVAPRSMPACPSIRIAIPNVQLGKKYSATRLFTVVNGWIGSSRRSL